MSEAVQAAPREQGWARLLLALAAFLFLPAIPVLGATLPVTESFLLLVPAFAVCTLVGWWAGGRAALAVVWVPLAVFTLVMRMDAMGSYGVLLRAWAVVLAGAFGLLAMLDIRRPFFTRALSSVAMALVAALTIAMALKAPVGRVQRIVAQQMERRNAGTVAQLRALSREQPDIWATVTRQYPNGQAPIDDVEDALGTVTRATAPVFVSLLALESLAALALAWALYHRLGRARLGPPLSVLGEFRFNDQLVWGLIVGLTILLLPSLAPARAAGFRALRTPGLNLIVFFLSLYALRGFGVLSWMLSSRTLSIVVAVALVLVLVPMTAGIALPGLLSLVTAAGVLGLGDTWFDWRRRARLTP
jgi:hypothetical protein